MTARRNNNRHSGEMLGRVALLLLLWLSAGAGLMPGHLPGSAQANDAGVEWLSGGLERSYEHGVDSAQSSTRWDTLRLFWNQDLQEGLQVRTRLEQEQWRLAESGNPTYIDLALTRLWPRMVAKGEGWEADLSLIALRVEERSVGVYQRVAGDTDGSFLLPALSATWRGQPWILKAGFAEQYEIIPLDGNQYAVSVEQKLSLGAGMAWDDHTEAVLQIADHARTNPAGSTAGHTDLSVEHVRKFETDGPTGLREVRMAYVRQDYGASGLGGTSGGTSGIVQQVRLQQHGVIQTGSVRHFITHRVRWETPTTVYARGTLPESLVETPIVGQDVLQSLEYAGFIRLGAAPYFFTWGVDLEYSLARINPLRRQLSLKFTGAF